MSQVCPKLVPGSWDMQRTTGGNPGDELGTNLGHAPDKNSLIMAVIQTCEYQMVNPVGKPGDFYPIGSGFGSRVHPITGEPDYHAGIDIPADEGTPVRAAMDGMITHSYTSSTGGNTIYINHGNGLQTRYLHMRVRLYEEGDFVRAGMQIGTVGHTGSATGDHLHFEMRMGDKYINPTDCYNNAQTNWANPYLVPDEYAGSTEDYTAPPVPSDNSEAGFPWWMVFLGLTVVGFGAIVVTSDNGGKKTPQTGRKKRRRK